MGVGGILQVESRASPMTQGSSSGGIRCTQDSVAEDALDWPPHQWETVWHCTCRKLSGTSGIYSVFYSLSLSSPSEHVTLEPIPTSI